MVKSSTAQRESEGVIVPSTVVKHNTIRGKDPCFDRVVVEVTSEGMTEQASVQLPRETYAS
jgi:hypothetical protein